MQKRRASDTERFAPSPTGPMHLGHAYSALLAHDAARASRGRFLLRLEDLDRGRVRPEHVDGILEDLAWLGITFDAPPLFQSTRAEAHDAALQALTARG
ncbi:MAG: glutamate--tRNA ligase family protein, partial [Pseudomonadota bacterium]